MTRRSLIITALLALALVAGAGLWLANDPATLLAIAVSRERGAADLEQRSIRVGEHDIVYLDGGVPGGPTVLLLHGFAADKDNWTRFSAPLAKAGFRVVAPDLPGHGESSRLPSHTYDIPNQVAFVEAFRAALDLGAVHIAGNSMGGHIAGGYAATHPEQVRSLGLFNAGGVTPPEPSERSRIMEETGTNPLLVESVEDFDRFMAFVFVTPPKLPRVVKQYFADRAVETRAFNDTIWSHIAVSGRPMPLEPLLPRIEAPALILWGDTDRVLHKSMATVFAAGLPDSETVILKDCGHSPMIERPDETASVYIDFVNRAIDDGR